MKFRKKPILIEAEQWFPGKEVKGVYQNDSKAYVITAHNQPVYLEPGDWVVPEPNRINYYPIKPDIMKQFYDKVEE